MGLPFFSTPSGVSVKADCSTFHLRLEGHSDTGFFISHPWPVWLICYPTAQDGFTLSPFLAGSWWSGNPHKSGLALELLAMSCSYHQHQEISTKNPPCFTRGTGVDMPESLGYSSPHQGIWCSASRKIFRKQAAISSMCWQSQSDNYCVPLPSPHLMSLCPFLSSCLSKFNSSARWGLPWSSPFVQRPISIPAH